MLRRSKPRQERPSAWLLTFADLVSLMITFFVMLYAMKSIDEKRWEDVRGALSGALSFVRSVDDSAIKDRSLEKINLAPADKLAYLNTLLEQRFEQDDILKAAQLALHPDRDILVITMPGHLLFDTGSASLSNGGGEVVDKLADALRNLDNRITIAGHTDPTPVHGGQFETNWELSIMRAVTVLNELHAAGVIAPMVALGMADSQLHMIDSNLPKSFRYMQARRVEIIISGTRSADQQRPRYWR